MAERITDDKILSKELAGKVRWAKGVVYNENTGEPIASVSSLYHSHEELRARVRELEVEHAKALTWREHWQDKYTTLRAIIHREHGWATQSLPHDDSAWLKGYLKALDKLIEGDNKDVPE